MKVIFETSELVQEEINLIQSAFSAILAQRNITHGGITCNGGVCEVVNPSEPFNVTIQQIRAFQQAEPAHIAAIAQDRAARGLAVIVGLALLFSSTPVHAMSSPVFGANAPLVNSATRYVQFNSGASVSQSGTESLAAQPVAVEGTVSTLYASLTVAPGSGKSVAFALFLNGSTTASLPNCTISDLNTTCSDTSNSIAINPGDLASWRVVPTGTPSSAVFAISAVLTGTNSGETSISGGAFGLSNTTANYVNVPGSSAAALASTTNTIPTSGTIDRLYLLTSAAPGAGKSWAFTLFINGSSTAVSATCSDSTQLCSDLSDSIAVNAGDTINFESVPTGSPSGNVLRWGFRWRPTIDGETPIFSRTTASSQFVTVYEWLVNGGSNFTTTEDQTRFLAPIDFTFRKLYTTLNVAPGVGDTRTLVMRINGATGSLSALVNQTATSASDTTNSDAVTAGQTVGFSRTLTASPSAFTNALNSVVAYINPGGGGGGGGATGDPGIVWFFDE